MPHDNSEEKRSSDQRMLTEDDIERITEEYLDDLNSKPFLKESLSLQDMLREVSRQVLDEVGRRENAPSELGFESYEDYVENFVNPRSIAECQLVWSEFSRKVQVFLAWCMDDTLSTTGVWPSISEFWAYYHAAHVYESNGPMS